MNVLPFIPKYTVADYNMWEGDWELIDGHPVSMSPSPIKRHQTIGLKVARQIDEQLDIKRDCCGKCEVVYDLDWIINDNMILRPDIAVIGSGGGNFISAAPVLVVEILSPSTAIRDKNVKYEIYQEQGVKYYITIDPATRSFQAYVLTDQKYQPSTSNVYTIHSDCDITIDIDKVLRELRD